MAETEHRDWVDARLPIHHGDIRSLLSPDWHYISYETLPHQLFAWNDVLERNDRSKDPGLGPTITEFQALLVNPAGLLSRNDPKDP